MSDIASPPREVVSPNVNRTRRVALIGNPNTGKTTLFNALTGFRRHVANYPGVTVDIGRGPIRNADTPMELLDLPGTYSLAASSPDEVIVSETLCGNGPADLRPDVVLAIVDASNLTRNLYLLSQLIEFDIPLVVALNMTDIAESRGIQIDTAQLASRLNAEVVPIVATRNASVAPVIDALQRAALAPTTAVRATLPDHIWDAARQLHKQHPSATHPAEAVRVLLFKGGYAEQAYLRAGGSEQALQTARDALAQHGVNSPMPEVQARYAWINTTLAGVIKRPEITGTNWSDRVDRILTHRIWGAAILLVVLFTLFASIFTFATYPMDWIDGFFGWLAALVGPALPEGVIQSLVVDGVIAGVGGVLIFLPQILILFAVIAILEDCGYFARAAYMMDKLMRGVGLSGRAFIPLLSSFACAIPAIMGTRTIPDRRERFMTIMLAPFMSCSARLPVYIIMIAAFIPAIWLGGWLPLQPLVMIAMYLVGVAVAVPLAWVLRKTMFAGQTSGFVLELPSYKWPRLRTIWQRMYLGGREFIVRAGTLILLVSIIVWTLAYFPRSDATRAAVEQQAAAQNWDEATFDNQLEGAYLRDSYLGRAGLAIEPIVRPIGWDWKIGVSVIASFPAREVIIATLGTLFNLGGDEDEGSQSLIEALRTAKWDELTPAPANADVDEASGAPQPRTPDAAPPAAVTAEAAAAGADQTTVAARPLFTLPVALSIMVFFALCAQCGATLAVIYKETGSWTYPVISFVGMTVIAYFGAWGVAEAARAAGL